MYIEVWTPEIGESLFCKHDERLDAKELDENAVSTYKKKNRRRTFSGSFAYRVIKDHKFFY